MKAYIEVNCFANGQMNFLNRLPTEPEKFLEFDAKNLLDLMNKHESDTAFYSLTVPNDKSATLLFLVSKNQEIIDELKMKSAKESRSMTLFENEQLPLNSTFKSLVKTFSVDQDHNDFFLDDNGERYSFKVAFGGKANATLSNLNRFLDELDMFKEIAEKIANNPLERIKNVSFTTKPHNTPASLSNNGLKI